MDPKSRNLRRAHLRPSRQKRNNRLQKAAAKEFRRVADGGASTKRKLSGLMAVSLNCAEASVRGNWRKRNSQRCAGPRIGRSQGAGRGRAKDDQGRRDEGRSRRDQEEDRSGWRQSRNQVIAKVFNS